MNVNKVTKSDLERIEASINKLLEATKNSQVGKEYVDMLSQLVDMINQLRLTVEFDHEQRLRAIEDYLQEM